MKLGVMQPYFFPYIGYWQLMNAVDQYVVYDDVNFIKGGWINRNRILINGKPNFFNLPLLGASPNKLINEISVNNDARLVDKNVKTLCNAYARAPYFNDVAPIIERVLRCGKTNVVDYLTFSFQEIGAYLSIDARLILSSSLEKDCLLRGEAKVLQICEGLNATEYYNAIGGTELYDYERFEARGVKLRFLQTSAVEYKQFTKEFQPNLSIIDVMMFNSVEEIQTMLTRYELK